MANPLPNTTVCEKCGQVLFLGDFAFCPHGKASNFINRDEIPGGLVCENDGPEPVKFYSHSERRDYMRAHGLSERERVSPRPGTDKDPAGIPNPAGYVDPYTLDAAKALILRQQGPSESFRADSVLQIHDPVTLTEEEAVSYARK